MDHFLARCSRNLVLFCFYFPTAEFTKYFRDSRYNFKVTYRLYLHIKLWSWFEILKAIKTKGYTLNWLKKVKYHWKLNQLLYWEKNKMMIYKEYYYWLDKWRHQKRGENAVSKGVAFSSTWKISIKLCRNKTEIAWNQRLKHKKYLNMTQDRPRDHTAGTELSMTAVSESN